MPWPLMEDNATFVFRYGSPYLPLLLSSEVSAGDGTLHMPLVALKGPTLG